MRSEPPGWLAEQKSSRFGRFSGRDRAKGIGWNFWVQKSAFQGKNNREINFQRLDAGIRSGQTRGADFAPYDSIRKMNNQKSSSRNLSS